MNKYYTPETKELKEIYTPYQYRYNYKNSSKEWLDIEEEDYYDRLLSDHIQVRVKHLDRPDIESLGFNRIEECENYNNNESTYQKRVSDDEIYCLVFHYDINKVTISVHDKDIKTNMSVERKFQGTLKNKSELKQVLKMIGI